MSGTGVGFSVRLDLFDLQQARNESDQKGEGGGGRELVRGATSNGFCCGSFVRFGVWCWRWPSSSSRDGVGKTFGAVSDGRFGSRIGGGGDGVLCVSGVGLAGGEMKSEE